MYFYCLFNDRFRISKKIKDKIIENKVKIISYLVENGRGSISSYFQDDEDEKLQIIKERDNDWILDILKSKNKVSVASSDTFPSKPKN